MRKDHGPMRFKMFGMHGSPIQNWEFCGICGRPVRANKPCSDPKPSQLKQIRALFPDEGREFFLGEDKRKRTTLELVQDLKGDLRSMHSVNEGQEKQIKDLRHEIEKLKAWSEPRQAIQKKLDDVTNQQRKEIAELKAKLGKGKQPSPQDLADLVRATAKTMGTAYTKELEDKVARLYCALDRAAERMANLCNDMGNEVQDAGKP